MGRIGEHGMANATLSLSTSLTDHRQQSPVNSQRFDSAHRPPSTVNRHPSTVNRHPSTVNSHPSTVNSHPSTVNSQQSTVNHQQSTVNSQPSTVNRQQSTVNNSVNKGSPTVINLREGILSNTSG